MHSAMCDAARDVSRIAAMGASIERERTTRTPRGERELPTTATGLRTERAVFVPFSSCIEPVIRPAESDGMCRALSTADMTRIPTSHGDALHIVVTVDPYVPVPPTLYGGIERIADFLVRTLVARGHRVTLFAHPESTVESELVPYGLPPHFGRRERMGELLQVGGGLLRRARQIDVIHSFGRLAALLPILPLRHIAKVQTYQREQVPWRSVKLATRLAGSSVAFTACSTSVYRDGRDDSGGHWTTVFNGVDLAKYAPSVRVPDDAPLAFLGRLEPIKGVHDAIAIAKGSGRRLIIAGNRVENGSSAGYFDRAIAPHLGEQIEYIGPVDDVQKNALLGRSAALLMPIGWEEPFGIVMAEALACGTPVIGYARGSVPEVVREGVNGFACTGVEDAIAAVTRLSRIDRQLVRLDCERRFSHEVIVDRYVQIYRSIIEQCARPGEHERVDRASALLS